MELRVERDALADAVVWTARSLPARPPMQVLLGLLLEVGEDGLEVSGFDYEVSSRVRLDAVADEAGKVLVPGRLLLRRSRAAAGGQQGERGPRAGPPPHGTSTLTWVALTVATARTPTSSRSSSAASRDISETSRNGPAWISTCAMTVSRTTRVTMPGMRLRAEEDRVAPGDGGSRNVVATRARSAPSTRAGPPSSRVADSRSLSIQRRTVSSLTPSRDAASAMR